MRVFAWSSDRGTAYWRLQFPFAELARRGHDAMVSDRMPACVQRGEVDVLVASRTTMSAPSSTFQRLCREARMLCVYECDDDFMTVTPDNHGAYTLFTEERGRATAQVGLRQYATGEVNTNSQANIRANLAAAHLVTVSTDHLAGVVRQFTSAPVVVLPNRVPRWLTEVSAPWDRDFDGPLTVGHTGGASHVRDFGECARPLRAWLQRQGEAAEFHAIGYDSTARVASIRGRTRHTGWTTDVDAYLRSIDFGVGLAPLRDTLFARSKSALKAMEYGALGIPVIASDVGPYSGYVRHGETGFLCSTARDWRDALDALLDPDLRHEMGLAGRLQACGHLIEDHAGEWLDAYESAMSGRVAA